MKRAALMSLLGSAALLTAAAPPPQQPLRVYGSDLVLEIAPILAAQRAAPAGTISVHNGGVPNLWNVADPVLAASTRRDGATPPPTFSGLADLAANAETQVLRMSVAHPDVRIIMTVTEGLYEVVARRSAGIAKPADLRGKRIATYGNTSAAFYLQEALVAAGLTEADVTIVSLNAADCAQALIDGKVDAVVIWEPEAERARQALKGDVVEFDAAHGYRELYSLSVRTDTLADPARRKQVVALLRGVTAGCEEATKAPGRVQEALVPRSKQPLALIAASWKHHRFSCGLPADLVDVMVREEAWLAKRDGRLARPREAIAALVDPTVLAEATSKR